MQQVKQSSATRHIMFLMVDSTDHVTGKTGLTPTVTLSKNAAAFAAAAGAVTEVSSGWYKLAANATDSNTIGLLALHATGTAADPTDMIAANIVAYDPDDAVRLGLTALPNATAGANTGLPVVGTQVPNATAGASAGLLISGSNSGTTTLAALTITGTTTHTGTTVHTGNVSMAAGLTVTQSTTNGAGISVTGNGSGAGMDLIGGNAVTTTPAGAGFKLTGGTASTGAGGVAGVALVALGGAGAASTNGAAVGVTLTGGGTNTVASAAHGFSVVGASTGAGLNASSGAGATGNGITATALSTNGSGMTLVKTGTGSDLNATVTPLTLAKTTNITGFNDIAATAVVSSGAITTSGGAVSTVTTLTNLPAITANWLTAAGINAAALNGKGDWNVGKTGYALTATTGLGNQTANITGNLIGTVSTLTTYTGNTLQTADVATLITTVGAAGAGLTAVADQVWDEDATAHQTAGTFGKAIGDPLAATNSLIQRTPDAVAGATNGLFIAGTNAATTVTTALTTTFTGNLTGSVGSVTAAVGITSNVKKNQALAKVEFMITDSTTHAPKTSAASIVATRSIDGGAFAAGTLSAVTEVSNGIYYVDFASGDLNGNVITLRVTATASDDVFMTLITAP